ncbi:MAG TPA: SET domain-containing protein-lysine N-methyltransferase [Stellaceae bacterium]|nr:SET domain-containing protein-lysine N-methyltransferase [Stellaceae bacterium]
MGRHRPRDRPGRRHIADDLVIAPSRKDEYEGSMMHLNHSCEPNVGIEGQIVFVTMRAVEPGEELTIDYAMMDDFDGEMVCACGAGCCRRTVTGRDWRRPELQEKYRDYFSAYLQRRIAAAGSG